MLNFAIGPVQSFESVCKIGCEQVPYFRTPEFSSIMLENEGMILEFANAPAGSRAVFLTGSGTAAMEASVTNCFSKCDRVLVVNGGSFGKRFVQFCQYHQIPFTEIPVEAGKPLTAEMLSSFENQRYTGFLVNLHETSTGVLYDASLIREFCKRNHLFLVVDAISTFLADPFHMQKVGADVVIVSSQKALGCPPGISALLLAPSALERINQTHPACMYFDLKDALTDGERGQTPFTPAVGILLQIHARLHEIKSSGGVDGEIARVAAVAQDFREKISTLPLSIFSHSLSNAVTPLHPQNMPATKIVTELKDNYGIWVCPNGGELADKIFRVGHLGALTPADNTKLVDALIEIQNKGCL